MCNSININSAAETKQYNDMQQERIPTTLAQLST